jgi:hypothetical protein
MAKTQGKWTLVQHSGIAHDAGFINGVEEASVERDSEVTKIENQGGLLFDTYEAASEAMMAHNYPDEVKGLYPRVRGTFSRTRIGGRRLYLPPRG